MVNTTTGNGQAQRKQLSAQLDRFDEILDGLAEALNEALRQGLAMGEPLGIDSTTRFATHNYTKPLTESELSSPSPYNTRVNAGLPPGPIGNPGLAAIKAAAKPAKVDYRFFVVKPGAMPADAPDSIRCGDTVVITREGARRLGKRKFTFPELV